MRKKGTRDTKRKIVSAAWKLFYEQGYDNTYPPDGGVTVSVLLPDADAAPRAETAPWGKTYGWFLLEDSPLLVFSLADCGTLAWYGTR